PPGEQLRGAHPPVMEEDDPRRLAGHVLVDRDDVDASPAQGFEDTLHFRLEHPPMCMNMTFGVSQKKWLCKAVTSSPLSRAALITGLTWSSSKTRSPITVVCRPTSLKAAHEVSPMGGVRWTPATVTLRSLRAAETLKTPSFSRKGSAPG